MGVTQDVSSAVVNSAPPKISGSSFESARAAPGNYRITGDLGSFGGDPDVKFYRDFSSETSGGNLVLSAGTGEVGALTKTGAAACVYANDTDGFGAIAARAGITEDLTALSFAYDPTEEFFIFSSSKTPNGWAFPGQIELETDPTASVLKDSWPAKGDSQGGLADLCTPTVLGTNVSVSGNSSQPGGVLSPLVAFADWWDWRGFNDFSFYQIAGSPDPIVNNGYQECMISSSVTGATKTTGTKLVSQSVPVHGTGTDIDPDDTEFDNTDIWSYFTDVQVSLEGLPVNHKSNMLRRATYWASGSNSYQCVMLLNASTIAASTRHWVKNFTYWGERTVLGVPVDAVEFTTTAHEMTVFTHCAIRRPDKTFLIKTLAECRI